MKSIRRALIMSIVGSLFLLTLLFSLAGFLWERTSLTRQLDTMLTTKAESLANLVELEPDGKLHVEFVDRNMPEFSGGHADLHFQVWRADGAILTKSHSLKSAQLPRLSGTVNDPGATFVSLPTGQEGRAIGFQFNPIIEVGENRFASPSNGEKLTIVVASDTTELRRTVAALAAFFTAFTLLLPLAGGCVVVLAVRQGLRPLGRLATEVSRITPTSLETAITAGATTLELSPITLRLNELLTRLDESFKRERRFTMDASHELRTPLAEIRAALEIALKWPDDHALLLVAAKESLEATHQMETLVTALLALARAHSPAGIAPLEDFDLAATLRRCWEQANAGVPRRASMVNDINAEHFPDGRVLVQSNRPLVTAILLNLLQNAIYYSTPGSDIYAVIERRTAASDSKAAGSTPPAITLTLQNEMAAPLAEDELQHLFEPLWRKDKSRADHDPAEEKHFGVGLALVRAYCDALEIPVTAFVRKDQLGIQLSFRQIETPFRA